MKTFVSVYDDARLLPHFLRHYLSQGSTHFFIAADPAVAAEARRHCAGFPAQVIDGLNVEDSAEGGTIAVTAMRLRFSEPEEWVALADLDEFQEHPGGLSRSAQLAQSEGANVVRGILIDRVAQDGSLPVFDDETDLWKLFPVRCRLTKRLQRGADYKAALVRGPLLPALAHHRFQGERVSSRQIEIHHFKWNAAAQARMRGAIELLKARGLSWRVEYERVLDHIGTHGRIRWEDFL